MAQPLTVAFPPGLVLWAGCTIRVTALDPATGNTVAGVTVSNVSLECDQLAGSTNALDFGPFMFVPGPGA